MLVVHMDSGLGNQMLDYAEYLAIKRSNPGKECYLETLVYELPARPGMFSMWNGYELERIFDIKVPNIREKFDEPSWQRILRRVEDSKFWEDDWNYPPVIVEALAAEGIRLENRGEKRGSKSEGKGNWKKKFRYSLTRFFRTTPGYHIKRFTRLFLEEHLISSANKKYRVFTEYPQQAFVGHSLAFRYKGFGIDKIDEEIREAFCFPEITDTRNQEMLGFIRKHNAVAIHARRSDFLSVNGHCYRHGFFKRAVRYIKKKTVDPVFIFFTDEHSVGWCEENEEIFGLDFTIDLVRFATWNTGEESYRDMQLMAECKHNIFTESSFGFWGAYLNRNPDKITCAPDCMILATRSF